VGTHQELWRRSPTYRRLYELHSDAEHDMITDQSYDHDVATLASFCLSGCFSTPQ